LTGEGITHEVSSNVPEGYALSIPHPNPSYKIVSISYAVPQKCRLSLDVYDVNGRHVRTLISANVSSGYYSIRWYGDSDVGESVASGVYFIYMKTESFNKSVRVVMVN